MESLESQQQEEGRITPEMLQRMHEQGLISAAQLEKAKKLTPEQLESLRMSGKLRGAMGGTEARAAPKKQSSPFENPGTGVDWEKWVRDHHLVPPDDDSVYPNYPSWCSMGEILDIWPVAQTWPPPNFDTCDTLRRLDFQDPDQYKEAEFLRDAELPFIIYNIPEVEASRELWTDEFIGAQYGNGRNTIGVHVSPTNHFMYYNDQRVRSVGIVDDDAKEIGTPTDVQHVSYEEFAAMCRKPPQPDETHMYWSFGSNPTSAPEHAWVMNGLPSMQQGVDSFFMVEPESDKYEGVTVRMGMAGIIAEAHYDGTRNFVTMIRGHRRYIVNPPDACEGLNLFHSGGMDRHTRYDFTSPDNPRRDYHEVAPEEFYETRGLDVVITAGDSLYIPGMYIHTPISLDKNMQTNCRSGFSPMGDMQMGIKCGFGGTELTNPDMQRQYAEAMERRELIRSGLFMMPPLSMPPGGLLMTGERPLVASNGAVLSDEYDPTFGGRSAQALETRVNGLFPASGAQMGNVRGVAARPAAGPASASAVPATPQDAASANPFANPMWITLAVFAGLGMLAMGYAISGRVASGRRVKT